MRAGNFLIHFQKVFWHSLRSFFPEIIANYTLETPPGVLSGNPPGVLWESFEIFIFHLIISWNSGSVVKWPKNATSFMDAIFLLESELTHSHLSKLFLVLFPLNSFKSFSRNCNFLTNLLRVLTKRSF